MKTIYLFLLLGFLLCTANAQNLNENISTNDVQAKNMEKIKEFYIAYATEIASSKSVDSIKSSINSLKCQYMTPELIGKLSRLSTATGADPVIRAQDFNEKAIETLDVKPLKEDWYMVSYSSSDTNGKKQVFIPLRVNLVGERYLIDYITPDWSNLMYGNHLLCSKSVSQVNDTSTPLLLLKTFYETYLTEYCNMPVDLEHHLETLRGKYCTEEALQQFRTAADTYKADGAMGYDLLIDYFDFDSLWLPSVTFTLVGEDVYQMSYSRGSISKPIVVFLKIVKREGAYKIGGIFI